MLRSHKNKIGIITLIAGLMAVGSLSFRQAQPKPREHAKNLKVLPKDISHTELIAIMHEFEAALNFKCSDCHVRIPNDPKKLDFASDAKPEKRTAREMMRMVKKINRKYFKIKGDFADNFVNAKYEVSCFTCHHGDEHPAKFAPVKERKHHMPSSPHENTEKP